MHSTSSVVISKVVNVFYSFAYTLCVLFSWSVFSYIATSVHSHIASHATRTCHHWCEHQRGLLPRGTLSILFNLKGIGFFLFVLQRSLQCLSAVIVLDKFKCIYITLTDLRLHNLFMFARVYSIYVYACITLYAVAGILQSCRIKISDVLVQGTEHGQTWPINSRCLSSAE